MPGAGQPLRTSLWRGSHRPETISGRIIRDSVNCLDFMKADADVIMWGRLLVPPFLARTLSDAKHAFATLGRTHHDALAIDRPGVAGDHSADAIVCSRLEGDRL